MSSSRGDPSWRSELVSSRRKTGSGQARIARNAILLIFLANALVSLFISIIVFFVLSRVTGYGYAPMTPLAAATQPAMATIAPSSPISLTEQSQPADSGDQAIPDTYTVRSGDNLSAIAVRFGVTLESLMAANGIQNPDWIAVGQRLVVPRPGAPQPTPTVPPVPTPTETPLPFEPPTPVVTQTPTLVVAVEGQVTPERATSVSSNEPTPLAGQVIEIEAIRGRGDLSKEQVLLVNKGQVVDLSGWTLSDKDGNVFSFPAVVLWPGADLRLHTGVGNDTPTDLYWNQTEAIWNGPDEMATLKNAKGQVILTYRP